MIRIRNLLPPLLTIQLGLLACGVQVWAEEFGYPPPPGPYRSSSAAEPAASVQPAAPGEAGRGGKGLLPLLDGFDTYSPRDTADILFGSAPPRASTVNPGHPQPSPGPNAPTASNYSPNAPDHTADDTGAIPPGITTDDDAAGFAVFRPAE